jgi:methionyl-tRNA formyltransferase
VPDGLDLILCAHAHVFVTASARQKARLGALGYHPSLLPRHRGRDAIVWTLHMGDLVAGGSAYWLDDGADTGDIAAQDWCWVKPCDTPDGLWRRELGPIGLRLLGDVLKRLDAGEVPRRPQDEAVATWEPAYVGGRLSGRSG